MKIQLYTLILKNIYIIILHLDYSHFSRDKSLNSKRGRLKIYKRIQKLSKDRLIDFRIVLRTILIVKRDQ